MTNSNELEHLRVKLETLKAKYNYLVNELSIIQSSETCQLILKIDDWTEYFENQKALLKQEHESLTEKYVKVMSKDATKDKRIINDMITFQKEVKLDLLRYKYYCTYRQP